MKTEGNEPIAKDEDYGNVGALGLTKREYFAAMAMQGLLSNTEGAIIQYDDAARQAVSHADALITALNKKEV